MLVLAVSVCSVKPLCLFFFFFCLSFLVVEYTEEGGGEEGMFTPNSLLILAREQLRQRSQNHLAFLFFTSDQFFSF